MSEKQLEELLEEDSIEEVEDDIADDDVKAKPLVVTMKENLYDRIDVSLKTMNMLIGFIVVAIIVFIAFGIWQASIR